MASKSKIHVVKNGRIYWSKNDKQWFFVYEGTFLTALANTGHKSDRVACEAARPQTLIAVEQVAEYLR